MTTTIRGSDNFDTADNATQTELDAKVVGKVLQVVHYTNSAGASTTSETYQDTNLSGSITPSSTSSKILVIVDMAVCGTNGSNSGIHLKLVRDATDLVEFAKFALYYNPNMSAQGTNYLDSPNTTSAVTYKVQFRRGTGAATVYVSDNSSTSTLTLMEIEG